MASISKVQVQRGLVIISFAVTVLMAGVALLLDEVEAPIWAVAPASLRSAIIVTAYSVFLSLLTVFLLRSATYGRWALFMGLLMTSCIEESLLYFVAVAVPLRLPQRTALRWLYVQLLISIFLFLSPLLFPEEADEPPLLIIAGALALHLAWQIFAFGLGWMVERVVESRDELALKNQELKETRAQLATKTRIEERLELSRELHDTVGHHIAALSVNLDLAQRRAQDAGARAAISDARVVAQDLLGEIREVGARLRHPRPMALSSVLRAFVSGAAIPIQLTLDTEVSDANIVHVLYRCAQEATTNSIKHSCASVVTIGVSAALGGIRLTIADNGPGNESFVVGNGLAGMQERVQAIGGRLSALGGAGFGIDIWLPIPTTKSPETERQT